MIFSSTFRQPGEAWQWALGTIQTYGDLVRTEDGQLTKEVMNLAVTVEKPLEGWPVKGSEWSSIAALDEYANKEILSSDCPDGFRYSYGMRLFDYPSPNCHEWVDQIDEVIKCLKRSATSRRAIAITWSPFHDPGEKSVPCLQLLDFLIRGGNLNCTAFFRSWDVGRAAVSNMYGLAKLQEYVANQVGISPGPLTVIAASAHQYEV